MSVIYCTIDMFTRKASICNEDGTAIAVIDVDAIPAILPQYCYSTNVDTVHFIGFESYVNGIIENMKASTNYKKNSFNIKLN